MADVAVENPANNVTLHNKPTPLDTIPNINSLEGTGSDGGDEYATLKRLQRHLEYVLLGFVSSGLVWWLVLTTLIAGTFNSKRNTSRMNRGKCLSFRVNLAIIL